MAQLQSRGLGWVTRPNRRAWSRKQGEWSGPKNVSQWIAWVAVERLFTHWLSLYIKHDFMFLLLNYRVGIQKLSSEDKENWGRTRTSNKKGEWPYVLPRYLASCYVIWFLYWNWKYEIPTKKFWSLTLTCKGCTLHAPLTVYQQESTEIVMACHTCRFIHCIAAE